jgi:hypothetical protein
MPDSIRPTVVMPDSIRPTVVMPDSIRHPGLPALTVKAPNDKRAQDFLDCGSSPQ